MRHALLFNAANKSSLILRLHLEEKNRKIERRVEGLPKTRSPKGGVDMENDMEDVLQQRIREIEAQQMALRRELAELYQQAGEATRPPLSGVRVLDFSWAVFGPYSTQVLSDMGAEVIKVERVDGGDLGRETYSAYFTNRNKQSLAVDLQAPEGREIVLKLAESSHILLQSFRPGVVERLGIDYESVRQRNPEIVYCSLSGFGQDGPYQHRRAADLIIQGMSGMMNLIGHAESPPTSAGFLVCDITGALHNVIAMLLGYVVQQQRGIGQHIQLSLYDSAISLQSFPMTWYLNNPSEPPQRAGGGHWRHLPLYGVFETKDDPIIIMAAVSVLRDNRWASMTAIPGLEALAGMPQFASQAGRLEHIAALGELFQRLLRQVSRDEWMSRFSAAGILCGPVLSYDDVLSDPQFHHNNLVGELQDQDGEVMKIIKTPIRLSQTPAEVRTPMPDLGQHSLEILQRLGYRQDDIERLRGQGVIVG